MEEENHVPAGDANMFVIGVGASAGGLEALSDFLSHLPAQLSNAAIVVAQHLSPTYKSRLTELLGRQTHITVIEAEHQTVLRSNCVYITPPDSEITLSGGKLHLIKPHHPLGPKPSVDIFFQSLAYEKKQKAIGIILSGTGSDGARGIQEIKAAGGFTIAQEPQTARYNGMPLSAIETGDVDMILAPDLIAEELPEIMGINHGVNRPFTEVKSSSLDKIFRLLTLKTGTDFSDYKPSTICRRLEKRLGALHMNNVESYLDYVEQQPEELDLLFNTLLIGVTSFFRDKGAFEEIKKYVAGIIASKAPGDSLRIWVAGCASGEEAYSIAILLCEQLGQRAKELNVQIFATDIDEKAIAFARRGIYSAALVEELPGALVDRYFIKVDNKYELTKAVRSMVLFSKHDLTKNPPFLKIDMISCRNLLIYFGPSLQKYIIPIFHYVLNHEGYLFLGKSETVGQFSDLFTTVDGKNKIFQRKIGSGINAMKFSSFKSPKAYQLSDIRKPSVQVSIPELVKETFYSTFEHPYVIISDTMEVMEVYGDVRLYLSFPAGTINTNIIKLIVPDLQIELRSVISRCIRDRVAVRSQLRRFEFFNSEHHVRFVVKPLNHTGVNHHLFVVIFEKPDPEDLVRLSPGEGAERDSIRVQELEKELAALKEQLQTFIEELETSNEELQALNEELQSANEELQSSNEELETGNEELQATNEEMQVAYTELREMNGILERREDVLRRSNSYNRALINSALQYFVLIDTNYQVLAFNRAAADFNKRIFRKEMIEGASIFEYIATENLEEFHKHFSSCVNGEVVNGEQKIRDSQGHLRWLRFNYVPIPDKDGKTDVVSLSMLEVTEQKLAEQAMADSEKLASAIFDISDIGICIIDENLRFIKVNAGVCKIYGYEPYEMIGQSVTMIIPPENRKNATDIFRAYLDGKPENGEWKVQRKDGVIVDVFNTNLLLQQNDRGVLITTTRDVTESKKYRNLLLETQESVKIGGWEMDLISHENTWTEEVFSIYEVPDDFLITFDNVLAFYQGEVRLMLEKAFRAAIEKGEPYDLELEMVSMHSNKKWVRMTCKPVRVYNKTVKLFGTIQDITSRKMAERDIENLSLVASKTNNAVIITDANGYVEWVNDGFQRITGYSLEEAFGKKPGQLLQGKDTDPATVKRLSEKLKLPEPFSEEILNYRRDGTWYWLKLDITPILNNRGEIINHIAIQSDITERKLAEEELRLAKEKAEELNRLKSRFLSNMSHEIRTPLNGIMGMSQVVLAETSEPHTREYIKLIDESGMRLLQTINNIIDLSRIESGKFDASMTVLDVNVVVEKAVCVTRPLALHKGLILQTDYEADLYASLDEYFMLQVVSNLLVNAVKFTDEGQITVATRKREDREAHNWVSISVKDTGIGIEEEYLAKIFQPFERRNLGYGHRYEGTGLGLSIVKSFVEAMNGKLILSSQPGHGSCFEVMFPVQAVVAKKEAVHPAGVNSVAKEK